MFSLARSCDVLLVGGVQVNTAPGTADYFQPLACELKKAGEDGYADLLPELAAEGARLAARGPMTSSILTAPRSSREA